MKTSTTYSNCAHTPINYLSIVTNYTYKPGPLTSALVRYRQNSIYPRNFTLLSIISTYVGLYAVL